MGDEVIVTGEIVNDVMNVTRYALLNEEVNEFEDIEGEAEGEITQITDKGFMIDGQEYEITSYTYFEDESTTSIRQFGPSELNVGDFVEVYYLSGDEGERFADWVIRIDENELDLTD